MPMAQCGKLFLNTSFEQKENRGNIFPGYKIKMEAMGLEPMTSRV